jgi:tRNA(Ile)-lysidine synthase
LLARAQAELDGLAAGDLECARLPTAAQAPPALDRRVIGRLSPFRQAQLFRHWWRQLAGGQGARMPSEAQCEEWRAQMIEGGSSQAIVHFSDWVFVRFRDRIEAWAVRGSGPVAQSLAQLDQALPPVLDLEWRGETEQDLPGWGASLVWGGGAVEGAGRARWPRGAVIIRVASGSGEMRMRLRAGGPSRSLRKLWQERGVPPVVRPWLPVLEVNGRPVFVAGLGPVQGPEPPQPAGMGQADAADEPPRADALVRAIAFVPRSASDPRGRFCGLDRL